MRRLWRGYSWFDIARMYDPRVGYAYEDALSFAYFGDLEEFSAYDLAYADLLSYGTDFWDGMAVAEIDRTISSFEAIGFSFDGRIWPLQYAQQVLDELVEWGYLLRTARSVPVYRCARAREMEAVAV